MSIGVSPSGQEQTSTGPSSDSKTDSAAADSSTTARMATAAHSVVDTMGSNLEHAESSLRDAGEAAADKASEAIRQAKSYSEDAVSSVTEYIHLYPLRSMGIAVAAGYLISALTRR
jgi:ElaB/YqjD/DUF883 family membrane-anchored ribosome-binding protein